MNNKITSKRNKLMLVISIALICALAVAGTIAYLNKHTGKMTNTFTVGDITQDSTVFQVVEHEVTKTDAGDYKLTSDTKIATNSDVTNQYNGILPGSKIAKDPTISVANLTNDAYLFIGVKNNFNDFIYSIDSNWTTNTGLTLTSASDINIYVYKTDGKVSKNDTINAPVISGSNIVALDTLTTSSNIAPIEITTYLVQAAGFNNFTEAWNATFGK